MPAKPNRIIEVGGNGSAFQGVMLNVSPKDMPPFVFQKLINLEPAEKIGSLKKRGRYKIRYSITPGDPQVPDELSFIKEISDKNNIRSIVALDQTDLYESIFDGTNYGHLDKITGGTQDDRYWRYPISQLNPIMFNKELRSGAGIETDYSRGLWYGYLDAQKRFPIGGTRVGETYTMIEADIAADRYLCDQLLYKYTLVGFTWIGLATALNYKTGSGLNADFAATDQQYLYVYVVPVYDGYQVGPIRNFYSGDTWGQTVRALKIPYHLTERYSLKITIYVKDAEALTHMRITHLDIFVSTFQSDSITKQGELDKLFPPYFLERIPLTDDGDTIMIKGGTFENDPTPTYIQFTDPFADWETFALTGFHAVIPDGTSFLLGARTTSTTYARYAVSGIPAAYSNKTYDFEIKSRWQHDPINSQFHIKAIYDDFQRKLGSYFFDYSGIPEGDAGLDDVQYKYACEAGRRYFIFGRTDGKGYYSLAEKLDVIPALNQLRLKEVETGCVGVDKDVLVFSKFKTTRIQVLSDTNAIQDDEFADVGCSSYKSIVKLNENTIAWMSYTGPQLMIGRQIIPIGEPIKDWWDTTLTDAQKEACCAGYKYKTQQLWFSFPTYTDTDFPYGIIFVFDLKAYRKSFISSWFYFSSDTAFTVLDLNYAGNLLGMSYNKIVEWNVASPTETFGWLVKLITLENQINPKKARLNIKKFFIDYVTSDAITAQIYFDGSATPTAITLNANYESFIHKLCETMELEIYAGASANEAEIKKLQLTFREKSF